MAMSSGPLVAARICAGDGWQLDPAIIGCGPAPKWMRLRVVTRRQGLGGGYDGRPFGIVRSVGGDVPVDYKGIYDEFVNLGKILAARGLAVTIVIIKPPYDTGAMGPFLAGVTAANPSISFHCLPTAEHPPVEDARVPNPPPANSAPARRFHCLPPAEHPPVEAARVSNPQLVTSWPALRLPGHPGGGLLLVVDFLCSVAVDVATELGIPAYCFFTCCAETLAIFLYLPVLHAQSTATFRDMGEELVRVPGISSFPAMHCFKPLMDRHDAVYRAFMRVAPYRCRSQGIIVNTFCSLEPRAADAISVGLCTPPGLPTPPVYCIGPLIKAEEVGVKRGRECLAWLDTQPKASVVFLCFGSRSLFSANQTRELAIGLEASGKSRSDALLPEGFLERTKSTGLIVKSWAPQRDVLAHDEVGAFVTHCGWNSVLETVMAGVPMLTWPLYAEQRVNIVFLEKELGLAVPVEGYDKEVVQADEVASKVSAGREQVLQREWGWGSVRGGVKGHAPRRRPEARAGRDQRMARVGVET
uniref:Glycosyltransferase n=1 Tax=Aegilops tauschii TaxID=37682 RepID=M8BRN6_AEGTA